YPTDSGLLEDAVRVVYRNMRRLLDAGITGRLVRQAVNAVDVARSQMKKMGKDAKQETARAAGKLETKAHQHLRAAREDTSARQTPPANGIRQSREGAGKRRTGS